jgi:hypothetical protein
VARSQDVGFNLEIQSHMGMDGETPLAFNVGSDGLHYASRELLRGSEEMFETARDLEVRS